MVIKKIIISDEIEELVGDCVVKSLNMHTELEEKEKQEIAEHVIMLLGSQNDTYTESD